MTDILKDAPAPVQKMFRDLWRDMESRRMEAEKRAAQANPVKHRLSRTVEGGTNYCYATAGKDGRGSRVCFCYSINPNVAGYFLLWRQIETATKITRDQWDSTTSKRAASRWIGEMAKKYKESRQK